ncbi:hypothetical protein IU421_30245 [Nocardia cyriacigeorgica]|uniref:hypothetical protein n=1 Tax=Nocardia cyriacigeorgica TaxID=135487 RepID=UPI001893E5DF|nr:hypothetical protein [Nocardia cyriacigeorgica]MBF6163068.1 hypothetical protein [Nocardia cyriacigeorgica]MBF6202036.1 hypothetical protein [Nocardia cyriacigeorgica]MBF6518528.1 hypothetical protein [Nocardia cyriacigeorgica]
MSAFSTDWDAEMRQLLEDSGIDPDRNKPMTKAQRVRRKAKACRGAIAALVVLMLLGILLISSGAPGSAVCPLLLWAAGVVAWMFWKAFGYPSGWQMADGVRRAGGWSLTHGTRFIGRRVWYPAKSWITVRRRAQRLRSVA